MRITLELSANFVELLAAQARGRELALDLYLQSALESLARSEPFPPSGAPRLRTLGDAFARAEANRSAPKPSSPRRKKPVKYCQ